METGKPLRILKLQAENIKRLKAVEIKPNGDLVIISGKNGQGKSSTLDSIMMALGGGKTIPDKPIREGEKKGTIRMDMGEFIVERTFTAGGSSLHVTTKTGIDYKTPQAMLDKLIGSLSFDPLDFIKIDDEKRTKILKELTGLDFTDLDVQYKEIYENRTMLNREVKVLEGQVNSADQDYGSETPDAELNISDLAKDYERANEVISANNEKRKELQDMRLAVGQKRRQVEELMVQINDLQEQLGELNADITESVRKGKELAGEVETLVDPELSEITKKMQDAEQINMQVRNKKSHVALKARLDNINGQVLSATKRLGDIGAEKENRIQAAKMPIVGLSFDVNGITYKGIPFAQICSSEQLKISLAIGLALNPRIRVILVRDGSLLDGDNLKTIREMAEKADAQIWLEKVDDSGKVGIVIEDGSVKAVNND